MHFEVTRKCFERCQITGQKSFWRTNLFMHWWLLRLHNKASKESHAVGFSSRQPTLVGVVYRTLKLVRVRPANGIEMCKTLTDRPAPFGWRSSQLHFVERCYQGFGVLSETGQLCFKFIDLRGHETTYQERVNEVRRKQ